MVLVVFLFAWLLAVAAFSFATWLSRFEADRQFRRWAETASAGELFAEIRPALEMLAREPEVTIFVEPLLERQHWSLRSLRDALHELMDAVAPLGFLSGPPQGRASWCCESNVPRILEALERRT
jgi:hypothetical protein